MWVLGGMPSQREIKRAEAHELAEAWTDAEVTVTGRPTDRLTQKEALGLLDAWLLATKNRHRRIGTSYLVRTVIAERLLEKGATLGAWTHALVGVRARLSWAPGEPAVSSRTS